MKNMKNNSLKKIIYKIKRLFRDRRYDIYCPYCTSCGETGCCSPTSCLNHPKGFYCETNQDALKVSYWTLNEFWNNYFEEQSKKENYNLPRLCTKKQILKEVEEALSKIHHKHYDEQYEYRMSTPKKLTLIEKIKNLLEKQFKKK